MLRTKSHFSGVPETKSKSKVCCAQIHDLRVCHTLKSHSCVASDVESASVFFLINSGSAVDVCFSWNPFVLIEPFPFCR